MANKAFEEIKSKMVNPSILRLPNFEKVVEVACDASHMGIGVVLSQDGHLVAFFSDKLNGAKKKNTPHMILNSMWWCKKLGIGNIISVTRNLFYIRIMKPCDILILNSQKKLNSRQAKWSSFLQLFIFNLKHCVRVENKIVDALCRKALLLVNMSITTIRFEELKQC